MNTNIINSGHKKIIQLFFLVNKKQFIVAAIFSPFFGAFIRALDVCE